MEVLPEMSISETLHSTTTVLTSALVSLAASFFAVWFTQRTQHRFQRTTRLEEQRATAYADLVLFCMVLEQDVFHGTNWSKNASKPTVVDSATPPIPLEEVHRLHDPQQLYRHQLNARILGGRRLSRSIDWLVNERFRMRYASDEFAEVRDTRRPEQEFDDAYNYLILSRLRVLLRTRHLMRVLRKEINGAGYWERFASWSHDRREIDAFIGRHKQRIAFSSQVRIATLSILGHDFLADSTLKLEPKRLPKT